MMYLRWLLQGLVPLAFYVFCYLTCWFLAGIATTFKLDKLPSPCRMHIHDDTIYGTDYLLANGCPLPDSRWSRSSGGMWWICRNPGHDTQPSFWVSRTLMSKAWKPGTRSCGRVRMG